MKSIIFLFLLYSSTLAGQCDSLFFNTGSLHQLKCRETSGINSVFIYYESGFKAVEYHLPNGIYKSWYPNGILMEEGQLKDSLKDGKWIGWNDKGIKKYHEYYSKGIKDGPLERFNYYNDTGELILTCRYVSGLLDGTFDEFNNGVVLRAGEYNMGIQVGFWKVRTANGYLNIYYKNGVLLNIEHDYKDDGN